MVPRRLRISLLAGTMATLVAMSPALAKEAAQTENQTVVSTSVVGQFDQFTPQPRKATRLDYGLLDDALSYIVLDMGPSLRKRMPRPKATSGTKFVHGHTSPYRMEGGRVTFDYINDSFLEGLSEYRRELERIGTQVDIATLSKNEQLAYWFNLHNLTMLEQIAIAYPTGEPSRIKVNINDVKVPLHDAKILNVKGQSLSLRDIREKIVYPNWSDPVVVYGFYRGDIGSPKINRSAFNAGRIDFLLEQNAGEFVNSLRGFRDSNQSRYVSEIYREMDKAYFSDFDRDLTAHLTKYAVDKVAEQVKSGKPFKYDQYQWDIADLSNGNRLGSSGNSMAGQSSVSTEIERFLRESAQKQQTLIQRGLITPRGGYVIIEDVVPQEDSSPVE